MTGHEGRGDLLHSPRPNPSRDTDPTGFTTILGELIQRVPGAQAATLVDSLGETVDYAGDGEPFDLRVTAAHLQILVAGMARARLIGEPRWLVLRGARKSLAASILPDGYVLGLVLRPRALFPVSTRALEVCARALELEAGLSESARDGGAKRGAWFDVRVEVDARGRPVRVGPQETAVEVLGAVMGLAVRERGFRVRTTDGSELTLVCEPKKYWYADAPVA